MMHPIGPTEKNDNPLSIPLKGIVQEGGEIDVKASAKEHPPKINPIKITKVENYKSDSTASSSLLEKEIQKNLGKKNRPMNNIFGFVNDNIPAVQKGLGLAGRVGELTGHSGVVDSVIGVANSVINLIRTPIKIYKAWAKWGTAGDIIKDFKQSPLVDVTKIKGMLEARKNVQKEQKALLEPKFLTSLNKIAEKLEIVGSESTKKEHFQELLIELRTLGLQDFVPHIVNAMERETDPEALENLSALKNTLQNENIDDDVTKSIRGLDFLLKDEKSLPSLLNDHVSHHDTLSALARNGLQAMSTAKARQEKKFYKFELAETNVLGAFTIISSLVTIVGFILTFTGVGTMPGAVAMALGVVGIGLSAGSSALGNIYAHLTAPNRQMEELQANKVGLSSLPYDLRNFYIEKAMAKKHKNKLSIEVISAKLQGKITPEQLEVLKPSLKKEVYELLKKPTDLNTERLKAKLQECQVKMEQIDKELEKASLKFKDKAEAYEQHLIALREAGIKDFAISHPSANLLFAKNEPYKPNIVDALASLNKIGLDEMTKDALKHYTGLDIETVSEGTKNEYVKSRTVLEREMLAFYGGTLEEILSKLKE